MDTKALRQKILDLAIRGKLVPQDSNDEPASVLLERIRQQKQQMVKEGKLKPKDIKNDSVIFVGEDNLHYEKFSDGSVKCIEDEIPFELPDGWAWARLSSIADMALGKMLDVAKNKGSLRPYLRNINVRWGTFDLSDTLEMRFEDNELERYSICYGDLVMCEGGEPGRCAVWKSEEVVFYQKALHRVRAIEILPEYLYYVIRRFIISNQYEKYYTGTTIKHLTGQSLRMLPIPLPPLNEQKLIVEHLQRIIEEIDKIKMRKTEAFSLVSLAKSKILDLAIRGKLVPQDSNDEPASVLLERIRAEKEELIRQGKIKRDKKESVIFRGEDNSYYEKIGDKVENISDEIPFELPDGWAFVRLKELCELVSGRDLSPSEYNADGDGIPYITGASNFASGKVSLVRWTTTPQVITEAGDLLLTCKGTIGGMAFNDFGNAHIARQIMAIRNTFALNSEYLALCMGFYINAIKGAAKGLIPGISREDILNLILPVPSLNYQAKVAEQVAEVTNIFSAIEKSLS